jgi:hypothetical protein
LIFDINFSSRNKNEKLKDIFLFDGNSGAQLDTYSTSYAWGSESQSGESMCRRLAECGILFRSALMQRAWHAASSFSDEHSSHFERLYCNFVTGEADEGGAAPSSAP